MQKEGNLTHQGSSKQEITLYLSNTNKVSFFIFFNLDSKAIAIIAYSVTYKEFIFCLNPLFW